MGSMFFERFSALCKERGETPNSVAKLIGASSGSVTAWKKGTDPRNATLAKIADHFEVTTDYLLGKENKAPTFTGERFSNKQNILKIAGRDGSFRERVLSDEQLAALIAIVDQMPDVPDDL